MQLKEKLKQTFLFVSLLRTEVYLLIFIFVMYFKKVPLDQLIQDKICLQWYNLTQDYCLRLPSMSDEEDIYKKKSLILGDVAQFNFWVSLVNTLPGLCFSFFIGSWTDRYINAKKILLFAGATASVIESLVYIWNAVIFDTPVKYLLTALIPTSIVGGNISCYTALWGYAASATPPKYRALRMNIMEMCIYVAYLIATFSSGKLLYLTPLFGGAQLYNYSSIFLINAIVNSLAALWAIFMINERREKKSFHENFDNVNESTADLTKNQSRNDGSCYDNDGVNFESNIDIAVGKGAQVLGAQSKDNEERIRITSNNATKNENPLRLLIDINNVKEILVTCLKRRDNFVRIQIWLLFLCTVCFLMASIGPLLFFYQFAQRVYDWDANTFSSASSLVGVANAVATVSLIPILVKGIKLRDTIIALIGLSTYCAQNVIRAVVLNPTGFYISIVLGALGSLSAVGIKSHVSKIVEHHELGKVFSLMSALEATTPLFAASIFTFLFKATVDSTPGMNFIITAAFLVPPILVFVWIDRFTKLPQFDDSEQNTHSSKL